MIAYDAEHAASVARKVDRIATRPKTLRAYARWLRHHVELEAPPDRLHDHAIGEGGSPRYHGAFVAWLTASPCALDTEDPDYIAESRSSNAEVRSVPSGYYRRPVRCALYRMRKRWPRLAEWVDALVRNAVDWEATVAQRKYDREEGQTLIYASLAQLWSEYSEIRVELGRRDIA